MSISPLVSARSMISVEPIEPFSSTV